MRNVGVSRYGCAWQTSVHNTTSASLRRATQSQIKQVVMVDRSPIRRFVSFFAKFALRHYEGFNNLQFCNPMRNILRPAQYKMMRATITARDHKAAFQHLFECIGAKTLFAFCTQWDQDAHTVPQCTLAKASPYAPTQFINLDGGREELDKLASLIGYTLPHQNVSNETVIGDLMDICARNKAMQDCLCKSYAADYHFFSQHGIQFAL